MSLETRFWDVKMNEDGQIQNPYLKLTPEGGMALKMLSHEALARGQAVAVLAGHINTVQKTAASTYGTIGFVYEAVTAADREVWVVFSGVAPCLLKDTTAGTAGAYVVISDVAGRCDATTGTAHDENLGRCLADIIAGTDVVATILVRPSFVQDHA